MNQAHKEHDNIENNKINYICNLHNESLSSFCKKCNKNLCMFCECEHEDKENIILYRDILPKKDMMKNQIEELKNSINKFKEKIQEIKNILDSISINLEIYYNINDNVLKQFEKKNRNFQLFKNMNEIIYNNINVLKELNVIKNENDKIKFFNLSFKLYENMNYKNSDLNQKENINLESKNYQEKQKLMNINKSVQNISLIEKQENKIKIENKIEINKKVLEELEKNKNIFNEEKNIKLNQQNNKNIKEKKINVENETIFDKTNKSDKNIYFANVAESMGRYEDMCNFLENEYKKRTTDFNSDERNLLNIAYKNLISNERATLRTILAYENKEKKKNESNYLSYIIEYKNKVFHELKRNCARAINFVDEYLLKRAKDDEAFIFYYTMKGNFNRYITECSEGDVKKKAENSASDGYNEAMKRVSKLQILNPVRLGFYYSYTVFLYEILDERKKAIEIVQNAINEAEKKLPEIDEDADENRDAVSFYNLLKETLDIWKSEEE